MNYSLTLTAEPLLYPESKVVAGLMEENKDKESIYKEIMENNLFQHKKQGSQKRVFSPVWRRLNAINKELLELFIDSDSQTSRLILLYSIMKTDRLVFDFINEVYKDKLFLRQNKIENKDFEFFYEQKSMQDEKLLNASETTKYKIKQVMFKIMIEAGILEKDLSNEKIIKKPYINNNLKKLIIEDGGEIYLKAIGG